MMLLAFHISLKIQLIVGFGEPPRNIQKDISGFIGRSVFYKPTKRVISL